MKSHARPARLALAGFLALGAPACIAERDFPSHLLEENDASADAPGDDAGRESGVTGDGGDPDVAVGTKGPIVFFAAHPDDETIGMAGAILQAESEGRPVYIELMTHGEASAARGMLDDRNTDSWHPGRHVYALSVDDFGDARVREFQDAMSRLGVTGVNVSDFGNGKLTPAQVAERIDFWLAKKAPGLSLRGTAGAQDPQTTASPAPHPDHAAVWNALVASGHPDVLGFCIYEAVTGRCHYQAKTNVGPFCEGKRDALAAYELWSPGEGRYAIAYHSTHGLLDAVGQDCLEYAVSPDAPSPVGPGGPVGDAGIDPVVGSPVER